MSMKLLAGAGASALLLMAGAADAATYTSKLEYSAAGYSATPFGTVTINELDAYNVQVSVALTNIDKIVDTGAGHVAFAFNLVDSPNSTVTIQTPVGGGSYNYLGQSSFKMSPFGDTWTNAFECCGKGASNGEAPSFVFTVNNTSGITFVGAGNHFTSNTDGTVAGFTGGWWFAVDTFDADRPANGNTFAVAARDFTCTSCTAVPEPSTWAMMIVGFGVTGLAVRRRRTTFA